jgi:predicted dehydrogenase
MTQQTNRRTLLGAGASLTNLILARKLKGANDRIACGFVGLGPAGFWNMKFAIQRGAQVVALCDVYQPQVDKAMEEARNNGHQPKAYRDFRRLIADPGVDAVCIHTPDHWHALIAVEACKAGKDVLVEKPIAKTIEEGWKMVQAARKYNRVVQVDLQQRSGDIFRKAVEIVQSGRLGKISACKAWNYSNRKESDLGHAPDGDPPEGLDYDMWLGPAPKRAFNRNRFLGSFRWFWDYAGGMMGDWAVHWLDIVHMAFHDPFPNSVAAIGGKYALTDARETPDTMCAVLEYPGLLATYEFRFRNAESLIHPDPGLCFHGERGTLFVTRKHLRLKPEPGSDLQPLEMDGVNHHNLSHWDDFLECIRNRKRPVSDIENGYRSTVAALLGNVAYRSGLRVTWDAEARTVREPEARRYLSCEYRPPWKLEV